MKKYYSFLYFFLFVLSQSFAQGNFVFSENAKAAYNKVLNLRFEEAETLLIKLKAEEPNNLIVHYIENYIDFFRIFINENKAEFERLENNKNIRLEKIKTGDKASPYYWFVQAEIKLQWALARLKFEEYFTAFKEVNSAHKLLTKNQEKFPDFIANKKSLGILHAMVGTIPDNYKWGVSLLSSLTGTIEQGRKEIEEVIEYAKYNDFFFEEETLVMYAFLMLHLNNESEEAWQIINSGKLRAAENPLACFVLANVAMRTGRNDEAIRLLENRPKSKQIEDFFYLDYMLGLCKLYRLDEDAEVDLEYYVTQFKGQNYVKEAYQKIAWFHLLMGNIDGYHHNMNQCKSKGSAIIGGDKTALKEARSGTVPNVTLLQGRLLFDGGYYKRAYDLLSNFSTADFSDKRSELELSYRLGRITHSLKEYPKAINYYQQTIDVGQYEGYYFACNAALQIGLIYEKQQNKIKAKEYYNRCLSIKPDEYKSSLHQKAKAGLNRLEKSTG